MTFEMRSHTQRQSNRLGAPHWLMTLGGIAKHAHIEHLINAIKKSAFHHDAEEFASKLVRDKSEAKRRVIYQAVMYVSANCPYTKPVRKIMPDGTTKIVNEECHLTYDQTLQALSTNDAGAFKGNLTDDRTAEERSMAHKWELFRQGYYVYLDACIRKPFNVDETKPFTCLCKPDKKCARRCPEALTQYKWDVLCGQRDAIKETKDRGIEIRMK